MKKKLVCGMLILSMAASLFMGGCNSKKETETGGKATVTTDQKTESDTFTMAISYMPTSLFPDTASDDYTTMVRPIFEPLYADTGDGMDYYLAESMNISEDGLTYTIKMNPKATWSDGEAITVDDILFTIEYSKAKSGGYSSYSTIEGQPVTYTKIDDLTLEIKLPKVYGTFTAAIGRMIPLPSHAFDNDPNKAIDTDYFNSVDMATSGAYKVSEINQDSIVYTRKDDYYRGTPDVKTVVLKTIGSGSTKQVAFENGEISYMRITTAEELEKYSAQEDKYNIFSVPEARLNYLQINPYGPANLTDDARKALFLAIDGQEVVDIAYGSDKLATAANSLLTPEQSFYNKDCKGYEQNLEEAKKLAKSSGLEGKTLTYVYNADRPNMEAVATVLQQQLGEIGVKLSIEGLDSTTFFSRFFAMTYGNGQETTWDLGTNGWDSERGHSGGQAYSYINNTKKAWGFSEETAKLAADANGAADTATAQALYNELQDKALSEYREYPLTYTNYVMVAQKNVTGLDGNSVVPEFIDYMTIKVD